MKYLIAAVLIAVLVLPVGADELWRELLPDHGGIMLGLNRNLDGQVIAAGSWDAFQLGHRPVEADVWSVSPLGGGLSWGILGTDQQPRYLGIGYDDSLPGDGWANKIVIYAKTAIALPF